MPGRRLEKPAGSPVPRYSVAGKYARPEHDNFVRHVAIVRDECELGFGDETDVWQTSPPIVAGPLTSHATQHKSDRCVVHTVAYLDDLTPDELAGIETTLAEIDAQTQPAKSVWAVLGQYVVHPPVTWVVDNKTGTRRLSAAAFVPGATADLRHVGFGVRRVRL